MAHPLNIQQTSVDLAADLLQVRQIGEVFLHPECLAGIVEGRFGT